MVTGRRLPLLLCLLVSLIGMQQLFALWKRQSSSSLDAEYQSQIQEHARQAIRAEREFVRRGVLWIGELHEREPVAEAVSEKNSSLATAQKHVATTVGFDRERLSADVELHECNAGSSRCSSGGGITVFLADRVMCRISVWVLQSQESVQQNLYKVWWEPREDGLPFTESEQLDVLRRLAGEGEFPDRDLFHRLLRVAYDYEPQKVSPFPTESIEKQIVRTVCRAIVHSRAHKDLIDPHQARPNRYAVGESNPG